MTSRPFPLSLVIVTCAILAGCDQCSKGKDEASKPAATAPQAEAPTTGTTAATQTQANPAAATPEKAPATGGALQITNIKEGTGVEAVDGKKVTVHYTGTLLDGTKFDSSKDHGDHGEPFSFVLGSGMVIAGWEQGMKGMKEGGVRKLVIPPELAYGSRAVGGVIPPNSTLVFEIELLKVE